MATNHIETFVKLLESYTSNNPFSDHLKMQEEANLEVYFSPFEHVNTSAKLAIVGISPGLTQAHSANISARNSLLEGKTIDQASELAKLTGSFSGALRKNLVAMLDDIGLPAKLGIERSDELFSSRADLLHSTSVFRYPTLKSGKPISSAKQASKSPILKNMVNTYLVDECKKLPDDCFYLPLGQGVADVMLDLVHRRVIRREQVIIGLPHPSGANAERIAYFLGNKKQENLSVKTNPVVIDHRKQTLLASLHS